MKLPSLLSQLEEPKFLRLFRHLVELPPPDGGIYRSLASQAIDLPNAEVHYKAWEEIASIGGNLPGSWYFQIAHCPPALWDRESFRVFVENSLRTAFADLAPRLKHANDMSHSDYYFFTNVDDDMFSEFSDEFTDIAHRQFSKLVGVRRELHPRFGYSTPQTLAEHAQEHVDAFIVDLLNQPSSYYLIARDGRVSVVPVTEHGSFFSSSRVGADLSGLASVVTSRLPADLSTGLLSEFEQLLNDPRMREQDFQAFLETHPQLLFAIDEKYCEVRPHVCLFDGTGDRLVPDFMARIHDSNIWDVIELKLPTHKLTISGRTGTRTSAAAAHGIAELLRYRDVFTQRRSRERLAAKFGTAPYEPGLVLVIGRGLRRPYEWQTTLAGFPRVRVVSYDYLFEHAKRCRAELDAAATP
jgi:hypothetical protein